VTNGTGALANTYTYDSFGKVTASTGTLANAFLYTNREFDSETSLSYYRARYYDPTIGRFLSEDPISFEAGVNFYAYVLNNPTNTIDPLGLDGGDAPGPPSPACLFSGICGSAGRPANTTAGPAAVPILFSIEPTEH
jgi:RHS repeat-associated protein